MKGNRFHHCQLSLDHPKQLVQFGLLYNMLLHHGVQALVLGGGRICWPGRAAHFVELEAVLDLTEGVLLAWLAIKHLPFVFGPMAGDEMLPERFRMTQQTEYHFHGNSGALVDRILALLVCWTYIKVQHRF